MMKRRIETRTFEYIGDIIEYQVVIHERPEPIQDNPYAPSPTAPYAEGGRCYSAPVVEPARETPARDRSGSPCLTRATFARAFQAEAGARGLDLPAWAFDRMDATFDRVAEILARFDRLDSPMPRRLRRALRGYSYGDLGFAYDRGFVGRIGHYFRDHVRRDEASNREYLIRLYAEAGYTPPMTVGAVLASKARD